MTLILILRVLTVCSLLLWVLSDCWLIAWRFTALDKLEPNGRTNEDQHFFNSSRSQNSSRGTELCFNAPDQGFSKFGFYLTFKTPFVLSSVQHSSVWSQVFKQIGADSLKPFLINGPGSQLGKHLFFTNLVWDGKVFFARNGSITPCIINISSVPCYHLERNWLKKKK